MSRVNKQLKLFNPPKKRGPKPKFKNGAFGGSIHSNYNPNKQRPIDHKKALHIVLRSSQARGLRSFKHKNNETKVWDIIRKQAKNFNIKLYAYANSGNHLHLLLRAKERKEYSFFIRAISGLIARHVGSSERGQKLKKPFWDARPFSRIVSFAKREFATVKSYLLRNTLEAVGWIKYIPRDKKLDPNIRAMLYANYG